jgi:23S rRNA pseudouridine1911/1915/1917 synthase
MAEHGGGLSRARWQDLIREGRVRVDGVPQLKPSFRLSGGERILAQIPDAVASDLKPVVMDLDIVYANPEAVVINKQAGVVVHPSAGHDSYTLVHGLLARFPELAGVGGERRPGVVHRLDKDTSGLIIFALCDSAMSELQRQFKNRLVRKTYLALVAGAPETERGRVEAAIARDRRDRKRMSVVADARGRLAATDFRLLERFEDYALVEAEPETGRTHQIRVHLAYIGCPVAGDRVYGSKSQPAWLPRQMLHAWRLQLRMPGEDESRVLEAPLPQDFQLALERLGKEPEA